MGTKRIGSEETISTCLLLPSPGGKAGKRRDLYWAYSSQLYIRMYTGCSSCHCHSGSTYVTSCTCRQVKLQRCSGKETRCTNGRRTCLIQNYLIFTPDRRRVSDTNIWKKEKRDIVEKYIMRGKHVSCQIKSIFPISLAPFSFLLWVPGQKARSLIELICKSVCPSLAPPFVCRLTTLRSPPFFSLLMKRVRMKRTRQLLFFLVPFMYEVEWSW